VVLCILSSWLPDNAPPSSSSALAAPNRGPRPPLLQCSVTARQRRLTSAHWRRPQARRRSRWQAGTLPPRRRQQHNTGDEGLQGARVARRGPAVTARVPNSPAAFPIALSRGGLNPRLGARQVGEPSTAAAHHAYPLVERGPGAWRNEGRSVAVAEMHDDGVVAVASPAATSVLALPRCRGVRSRLARGAWWGRPCG
jgi:hypothetical protein